ncbi:MAG TPA: hypothetical protein VGM57_13885 [Pseudolabrys sp.]|jgi:hypothetical protein
MRVLVDQFMGTGLAAAIVLAHVAALVWATVLRKGMTPALIVNLVLSAAVIGYNADHLGVMLEFADAAPLALTAYAAAAFLCAACALYGLRIPARINWTVFAVNFSMSVLLLVFIVTFKITRLI